MGEYRTIVADPPWRYGGTNQFQGGNSRRVQVKGRLNKHYPTMHTKEICALPIADMTTDPAVLLLWATWPRLPDAFRVLDAWGFEYVTGLPWVKIEGEPRRTLDGEFFAKPQYGIGFWVRSCSELLLIARRGDVTIRSPYLGLLSENFGHSRKPENVYEYAEQFPGPYLELFARRERDGWARWGNEVESTIALAAD